MLLLDNYSMHSGWQVLRGGLCLGSNLDTIGASNAFRIQVWPPWVSLHSSGAEMGAYVLVDVCFQDPVLAEGPIKMHILANDP